MVAGTDGKEDETGANYDEESSDLNSKRSLNSKSEFKVNLNRKKVLLNRTKVNCEPTLVTVATSWILVAHFTFQQLTAVRKPASCHISR